MPRDVGGERVHGGVAKGGILLKRFGENGIQVPSQQMAQFRICDGLTCRPEHCASDLGCERATTASGKFVGTHPCQNFVADDAQAIHIADGSNRLTANLFGTRVVRCKGAGSLRLGVTELLAQKPRDPKIQ